MEKRMANEAEGIVWKEINKGKAFVRAIGEWFGGSRVGIISQPELKALADACGVVLKEVDDEHDDGRMGMDGMSIDGGARSDRCSSVNDVSMSGHSMVMA
jgi:hypothetical protein